ncbi:hypothetical protein BFV67_22965 (plasmid) [Enterobacter roggenkampii]|nr:hypothetical protein BFV67_22965 [Enterobacter roggenkampii]
MQKLGNIRTVWTAGAMATADMNLTLTMINLIAIITHLILSNFKSPVMSRYSTIEHRNIKCGGKKWNYNIFKCIF